MLRISRPSHEGELPTLHSGWCWQLEPASNTRTSACESTTRRPWSNARPTSRLLQSANAGSSPGTARPMSTSGRVQHASHRSADSPPGLSCHTPRVTKTSFAKAMRLAVVATAAILTTACGGGEKSGIASTTTTRPASQSTLAQTGFACTSSQLNITWAGVSGGLGHAGFVVLLENSGSPCVLRGYPDVDGVDADGKVIVQADPTPNGYLGGLDDSSSGSTVDLQTGQMASALVEGLSGPKAGDAPCPEYEALLVTPPSDSSPTRLPMRSSLCELQVHPLVAGPSGGAHGS